MEWTHGIIGLLIVHIVWDWLKDRKRNGNPYSFINIKEDNVTIKELLREIKEILIVMQASKK